MPLAVTSLEREIKFKKGTQTVTLADPDPRLTMQEVLQHYGNQYPELTTATLEGPVVVGRIATYNVKTTVGTKG